MISSAKSVISKETFHKYFGMIAEKQIYSLLSLNYLPSDLHSNTTVCIVLFTTAEVYIFLYQIIYRVTIQKLRMARATK